MADESETLKDNGELLEEILFDNVYDLHEEISK